MFDLKNEKLEVFKNFIIGKDFEDVKFEWQDFSIESFKENKLIFDIDVTKAFGFLSTDEEYHYKTNVFKKQASSIYKEDSDNPTVLKKNVKSKLINRIFLEIDEKKLKITFEVNVYSRDISYPDTREYDCFTYENLYPSEYVTMVYDVENLSIQNDLLMLDEDRESILKSVDGNLDLNLFTQIDNLNPRIYLYMYIELILIMKKNKLGSFNIENILDTTLITSTTNIKELFANISNNKVSCEKFKQVLIDNANYNLRLIPLISLYELNLLVCRRGYYFPENSLYEKEFKSILNLSESKILSHYGLNDYKGYKGLIRINLENIYHIKKLESKGFKYKEVINILNCLSIYNARIDSILDSRLLDIYISKNSKKDVIKKLFFNKECANTIKDTIKMLESITSTPLDMLVRCNISRELITYDNIDKYFNFNLNIKNLEREVIEVYSLIDTENFNLYYTEKDGAKSEFFEYNLPNLDYSESEYLLYQDGEYSLWLPLNSGILKKVGTALHICVGSYAERIKNQKVVVLFVKKGNEAIGCIELDSKYEKLKQAKIRYNNTFNDQEQDFIYSFCVKNEISIETNDMRKEYNTTAVNGVYREFDNLANYIAENRVV